MDTFRLIFLRETNQEIIEELSYKHIDFLQAQLDITFEIIGKISPKIIVVSNSLASEFFGKKKQKHSPYFDGEKIWIGHNLDFEKDFNTKIEMALWRVVKIHIKGKIGKKL